MKESIHVLVVKKSVLRRNKCKEEFAIFRTKRIYYCFKYQKFNRLK